MGYKTFEDSACWQKANQLTIEIYESFRDCKDYSFRDQIQRASVSIMNNIAEGYERNTQKELKYFLSVAKGSSGEVRSMLLLAYQIGYVDEATHMKLNGLSTETSKLLSGFMKKVL